MQVRPMHPEESAVCTQLLNMCSHYDFDHLCSSCRTLVLDKNGEVIGLCRYCDQTDHADLLITALCIAPQWQAKGYGSYLLRKALHQMGAYQGNSVFAAAAPESAGAALLHKLGFSLRGSVSDKNGCVLNTFLRYTPKQLTSLTVSHQLLEQRIRPDDFVIDATAGLGRDTAYLCRLVGENGKVLAMDIQQAAVDATNRLLAEKQLSHIGKAILADHADLASYAPPQSVDAVVFNFGWLPGADHSLFTTPATSIPALEAALSLLKPGGFLVASIYHGGANGTTERDQLLPWFAALDARKYTVLQCSFLNRQGKDPIVLLVQTQ